VSKRFNEKQVLSLTLLLTGIGALAQFSTHAVWQVYAVTPFFAMAIGLSQANLISSISKRADSHVQGEVLGINASVQALAQSIPPILSGYIAASISPTTPLVIAGVVTIFSWLMYMLFVKSQNLPQFNQEL
jgi:MFS family permease